MGVLLLIGAYLALNTRWYIRHPNEIMPEYLPLRYTYVLFVAVVAVVAKGIIDFVERPKK